MKRILACTVMGVGIISSGGFQAAWAGCNACGDVAKAAPKCEAACPPGAAKDVAHQPMIGTDHLQVLVRSGVPLVLLDARSGQYDDGRRIANAKSLNAESSAEDVAKAIPSKNALVVTYCAGVKCPASAKLAAHLAALGYSNVLEYPEGIEGWTKSGNQVAKAN
jgi:rhodanese-related sulfurtransferase